LSPFLMPGITSVYSESLVFLLIAVAVPVISSSAGAGILVGYVLGDLAHSGLTGGTYASPTGRIFGFALLALLLLVNHLVGRRRGRPSASRTGGEAQARRPHRCAPTVCPGGARRPGDDLYPGRAIRQLAGRTPGSCDHGRARRIANGPNSRSSGHLVGIGPEG